MVRWVPVNAAAAAGAAVVGFGGTPTVAAGLGQVAFFVCSIGFLVSFVLAATRDPAR
jgi:uncharacterized membrane protein YtjA (UPF0391 family)